MDIIFNPPAPKLPSKLICRLRLLQARAISASFFVNKAEGLEDRVKRVNETHAGTFKARMFRSCVL